MNKKTIIVIILATLAILGALVWGYGNTAAPAAQNAPPRTASLAATESLYDFGTVSMADGKVSHVFELKNPTDKDVVIGNLETSCMCTTAYIMQDGEKLGPFGMAGMGYVSAANAAVPAQGSQAIEAVFDPAAHGPAGVGAIDRFVEVSEKNGGMIRLEIKAVVTP